MPTLRLRAEVFQPQNFKTIRYEGHHPSRVLQFIPGLMKKAFKITSTDFYEDEIKWDVSGDPIEFLGLWRAKDDLDNRTLVWTKIKVIGKQNKKDKMGFVDINIEPWMYTELPYSNIMDKMLAKSYSFLYYGNIRRKYIKRELIKLKKLENSIREELGLKPVP
jgi:hypothetical protein